METPSSGNASPDAGPPFAAKWSPVKTRNDYNKLLMQALLIISFARIISNCKTFLSTGVGSKLVAVKHALERCNNACYNLCTKGGLHARTSAA